MGIVEKDEQHKQEKKNFEATIRQMGFEINDLKRFHSDLRNENDHLNSEMDKNTNEKQTLQEDIKKWRLNSEKMKSEIEDLKERLKKEPEKSEMFNYNQQLKNEVESLKRANSLMRDNSTTDKTSYQEKISKLQAEIQQLKAKSPK